MYLKLTNPRQAKDCNYHVLRIISSKCNFFLGVKFAREGLPNTTTLEITFLLIWLRLKVGFI